MRANSNHGGARSGAGRKSTYGEPTRNMRIPESQVQTVMHFLDGLKRRETARGSYSQHTATELSRTDALVGTVDVMAQNEEGCSVVGVHTTCSVNRPSVHSRRYFMPNDGTTSFLVVRGSTLRSAGIFDGDELLVNRSLSPRDGQVVVAMMDGCAIVKKLQFSLDGGELVDDDSHFSGGPISVGDGAEIWGVVTYVLHRVY